MNTISKCLIEKEETPSESSTVKVISLTPGREVSPLSIIEEMMMNWIGASIAELHTKIS